MHTPALIIAVSLLSTISFGIPIGESSVPTNTIVTSSTTSTISSIITATATQISDPEKNLRRLLEHLKFGKRGDPSFFGLGKTNLKQSQNQGDESFKLDPGDLPEFSSNPSTFSFDGGVVSNRPEVLRKRSNAKRDFPPHGNPGFGGSSHHFVGVMG